MAANDQVFPQIGDPNDPERFAQLVGQHQSMDYVEEGLDVSADFSTGDITITEGVCYIEAGQAQTYTDNETVLNTGYVIQAASRSLSIQYGGDNYVVVEATVGTDDEVQVNVHDQLGDATDPYLHIATVDNDTNEVIKNNQDPDGTFDDLWVSNDLTVDGDVFYEHQEGDTLDAFVQLSPPSVDNDADPAESSIFWNYQDNQLRYKDYLGDVYDIGADVGGDESYITLDPESDLQNAVTHDSITDEANLHTPKTHGPSEHSYETTLTLGPSHHVAYEDGLDGHEVSRLLLHDNERFVIDRVYFFQQGGGSNSNVELSVYDATVGTTVATVELGSNERNAGETSLGASVFLQVTQQSGQEIYGTPVVTGRIVQN